MENMDWYVDDPSGEWEERMGDADSVYRKLCFCGFRCGRLTGVCVGGGGRGRWAFFSLLRLLCFAVLCLPLMSPGLCICSRGYSPVPVPTTRHEVQS